MSEFQIYLAIGAAIAALICILAKRWHGVFWIGAGCASFIFSTWYGRQDFLFPSAVTALCDVLICFAIYVFAIERWERYVFRLFQLSVLASIAYFAGWIGPHSSYVIALELINWLALGVIGGTPILEWLQHARGDHWRVVRHLRAAHRLGWQSSAPDREA